MGDLTRAQLRTEVVGNLGGRTGDFGTSGTDRYNSLNRALDRAQIRIVLAASIQGSYWRELSRFDTVTVTVVGTPATDVYYSHGITRLHKIRGLLRQETSTETGVKLIRLPRDQWEFLFGKSEAIATGRVTHYVEDRDSSGVGRLIWFQVPDTSFTLYRRYTVFPTPLTDLTASDLENKDELLINFATEYCFANLQQYEEAQFWFQKYNTALQEALTDAAHEPDEQATNRGTSAVHGRDAQINPWQDPFNRGYRR